MKKQNAETKKPLENDFESLSQGIDDSLLKLIQRSDDESAIPINSITNTFEHPNAAIPTEKHEKPTEALNTRIPKSLDDAIADWIYQSRKQGQPITKQQLTINALTHYLGTKMNG